MRLSLFRPPFQAPLRSPLQSLPSYVALLSGLLVMLLPRAALAASQDQERFNLALAAAERLHGSLEYEKALAQLSLARALPHGPEDEARLLLDEGIIYAELGQQPRSDEAFRAALQLQPGAPLPGYVSPKIQRHFESLRTGPLEEPSAKAPPPPPKPSPGARTRVEERSTPEPSSAPGLHPLVPALAGVALVAAGGVSWALSRRELHRLDTDDASLRTPQDVQHSVATGQTLQTLGGVLVGVGGAGLAIAACVYFLRDSRQERASLGVGTNGTGVFVHGSW